MADLALPALTARLAKILAWIETCDDRSIEELRTAARQGAFTGDIYDAPDDCDTGIVVTRGEMRRIRQQGQEVATALAQLQQERDAAWTDLLQTLERRRELEAERDRLRAALEQAYDILHNRVETLQHWSGGDHFEGNLLTPENYNKIFEDTGVVGILEAALTPEPRR
jgi:hypothetical protein